MPADLQKSPRLYVYILLSWLFVMTLAAMPLSREVIRALSTGTLIGTLVTASALFVTYFWLNGIKDLVYTAYYHLHSGEGSVPRRAATTDPAVVMVYVTCNDFSADSLLHCLDQRYSDFRVVILDDSSNPEYITEIDGFAARHGIEVVRRTERIGFKAGNLNHYLSGASYDYFVILDSDEIVPPNFIDRCLDYFDRFPNVGIVQANHVATRNRNGFMRQFSRGVDSHWIAYQSVKNRHGFLSLLGHGAMISRACYEAAGGFPHVVAEDLCFTIDARDAGYLTAFASDVTCEEEYPVSYLAFKRRHAKWTQGNMEFIQTYTVRILRSSMRWFEKLDIVLFAYNLPLTGLFSIYLIIHVVALPILGYSVMYPLWMLGPTLLFLFAPMLNDLLFHRKVMRRADLYWYLMHSMALYGSMFFVGLRSSLKAMFGKAVFLVTPKSTERTTLGYALRANVIELLFAIGLAATSIVLTGSILPVLLLVLPAVLSVYLSRMNNDDAAAADRGRKDAVR